MTSSPESRDLILIVADKNIEYTVKGLLSRPQALGISQIIFDVFPHPEHDPGCLLRAPEFLRPFKRRYRHALVLLDREGSGREDETRQELERYLEKRLAADWKYRAAAVVLDPELEAWMWSDSPQVDRILGWQDRSPNLRSWLTETGLLAEDAVKPERPKEAVERALRVVRKPRSSSLYRQLSERVSFRRCEDPAFRRFQQILQDWFPPLDEQIPPAS